MKVWGNTSRASSAIGPEEAGFGHAKLGVACGIETVTELARDRALLADPVEIEIVPRLLVGRERVVEISDGIRRIHHLQNEIGERLHVGVREGHRASEKIGEALLELRNASCSLNAPLSGCAFGSVSEPVRSPRQCIGPWLAMPRRLCVVKGPFIGGNDGSIGSGLRLKRNGLLLARHRSVGIAEIPG